MESQTIVESIEQTKKPKDMTPEEYLLYKRKLHNERMRRYLNNHPEKRSKSTPEQVRQYYENNKEKRKIYNKEYMREYMKEYRKKEHAKIIEIKELLKSKNTIII